MFQSQFEFKLNGELKYSQDGNFVVARKLLLSAPSGKLSKQAAKLEQVYKGARSKKQEAILRLGLSNIEKLQKEIKKYNKDEDKAENKSADAAQILDELAESEKLADALDCLPDLLFSGVCLVDGKIPMNSIHWEQINYTEQRQILGEYLAHFLS